MARPLRITYPGAFYHVTSRGNERKKIFKSKRDREKFLAYLESAGLGSGYAKWLILNEMMFKIVRILGLYCSFKGEKR